MNHSHTVILEPNFSFQNQGLIRAIWTWYTWKGLLLTRNQIRNFWDSKKGSHACEFTYTVFRARRRSVALINGDWVLQTVFQSARRGAVATMDITTPFVVEVRMLFHSIAMVEEAIQARTLKCSRSNSTGMLIGYTMQKISKSWMAHAEAAKLASLANFAPPYIFCLLKWNDFLH